MFYAYAVCRIVEGLGRVVEQQMLPHEVVDIKCREAYVIMSQVLCPYAHFTNFEIHYIVVFSYQCS